MACPNTPCVCTYIFLLSVGAHLLVSPQGCIHACFLPRRLHRRRGDAGYSSREPSLDDGLLCPKVSYHHSGRIQLTSSNRCEGEIARSFYFILFEHIPFFRVLVVRVWREVQKALAGFV